MFRLIGCVICIGILFGCATPAPRTPADRVNEVVELMKANAAKSDFDRLYANLVEAYDLPLGSVQVVRFFKENPVYVPLYRSALQKDIEEARSIFLLTSYLRLARKLTDSQVFSNEQMASLEKRAGQVAIVHNQSSYFEIIHGDGAEAIEEMRDKVQQRIITDRTIARIRQAGAGIRPVDPLMRYLAGLEPASSELKRIESILPSLNLRRSELHSIQMLYPNYFQQRLNELTVRIFLNFKNIDRLTGDDIKTSLRNEFGLVDWINAPTATSMEINIEKVRHDERTLAQRTETITYSYHQVDILNAVLLMPNNASYLYDFSTEGAEIEYGYVVTVSKNGKVSSEDVVRGKVGGEGGKCQNARIQNVFGGVSAANFTANDHMRGKCAASPPLQLSDLRNQVLKKVTGAVGKVPEIIATLQ